jgi:hypothetical protein
LLVFVRHDPAFVLVGSEDALQAGSGATLSMEQIWTARRLWLGKLMQRSI